jgi:hypothetical protein
MLRIPHCLDNRLIGDGKVVSPRTGRTLLPRNMVCFNISDTRLLLLFLKCERVNVFNNNFDVIFYSFLAFLAGTVTDNIYQS